MQQDHRGRGIRPELLLSQVECAHADTRASSRQRCLERQDAVLQGRDSCSEYVVSVHAVCSAQASRCRGWDWRNRVFERLGQVLLSCFYIREAPGGASNVLEKQIAVGNHRKELFSHSCLCRRTNTPKAAAAPPLDRLCTNLSTDGVAVAFRGYDGRCRRYSVPVAEVLTEESVAPVGTINTLLHSDRMWCLACCWAVARKGRAGIGAMLRVPALVGGWAGQRRGRLGYGYRDTRLGQLDGPPTC
mmetsp:Transcript_17581/g.45932  ORF Transcript_17581/g.45932 Transcript_17581/m.45932 type:complete len:245 (-) Transcript_17581:589-1323(-)